MPIIRLDPDSPMGRKLQSLQTLYYGLIAVPLILFLLLFLQTNQPGYKPFYAVEGLLLLHIVVWVLGIAAAFWAIKSYSKRIKAYSGAAKLQQKFDSYIVESRRLYFMLAPLMLVPVAVMWLTGRVFYGVLFSLLIILVASFRPTVEQFIERYRLSKEDQQALMNRT